MGESSNRKSVPNETASHIDVMNRMNRVVLDDEELDRIIFFPSMVENGNVSYSAFKLVTLKSDKPEKYLSVYRALYWNRLSSGVTFPPRLETDKLAGYATLLASVYRSARAGEIHCSVSQEGRNVFHAGVWYHNGEDPIKGDCDEPDFIDMLMDFAIACRFTEFEGESSNEYNINLS